MKKVPSVELLLSISAILLSLAALVVSIFQTKIAQEQQQASVWPHVQLEFSLGNEGELVWECVNNGVGPALIKQTKFSFAGQAYPNQCELYESQIKALRLDTLNRPSWQCRGLVAGKVIKAGDKWQYFNLSSDNERVVKRLVEVYTHETFHLQVWYSDVYGNCWVVDNTNVVTPLSNCPSQ